MADNPASTAATDTATAAVPEDSASTAAILDDATSAGAMAVVPEDSIPLSATTQAAAGDQATESEAESGLDAVAEAPIENQDAAVPDESAGDPSAVASDSAVAGEDDVTPAEPVAEASTEDAATMLKRILYGDDMVEAIYAACAEHNAALYADHRSVDPLTLGLLWRLEGGSTVKLDPADPDHRFDAAIEDLAWIRDPKQGGAHGTTWQSNAEHVWRISWAGIWGFGLDSITGGTTPINDFYDLATAEARWKNNMTAFGWPSTNLPSGVTAVPFEQADPTHTVENGVDVLTLSSTDAQGFLVAAAVRYTDEVWKLPAALESAEIGTGDENALTLAEADPVLAYLTFNATAARAAKLYAAIYFLEEICPAIIANTGGATVEEASISIAAETSLDSVVEVLDKWRTQRADSSSKGFQDATSQVAKSAVLSSSPRQKLLDFFVPEIEAGEPGIYATASVLTDDEKAELTAIIAEWRDFSLKFASYVTANPGQYMYMAGNRNANPQLVPADFGEFGFSVINFVGYATSEPCSADEKKTGTCPQYRYLTATGRYPWE